MRIIMEPTEDQTDLGLPQHKVVVEVVGDDHDLVAVGELLRAVLLAWGFHSTNVAELINV